MVFNNNLLLGAAGAGGGYTIDQSIRFNDDDSAYLEKTFASAGDRQKWTWSAWIKLSGSTARQIIFGAAGGPSYISINENATGSAFFNLYNAGWYWETAAKYRDPSAWYHLVWAFDTTNANAISRMRFYVNGSEVTDYSTKYATGSQNASGDINNNVAHRLGRHPATTHYYDGYLTEINFVDGQQLDPSSFGETNADTGQWVPIAYTGSYGTNGFYITGADSADLGADDSGNGNNFTSSGLTAADQVSDSPTDNFWTLNPLDSNSTLANGNLQNKGGGSTNTHAPAFPTTGKWYVEIDCIDINTGTAGAHFFGICDASVNFSQSFADHAAISAGQQRGGQLKKNNSNTTTGIAVNDGDTIALAFDADNLTLDLYVNNVQSGSQITGLTDVQYKLWIQDGASVTNMQVNFGQTGGFTYTPPTSFNALSTANLPDPTIALPEKYFNTVLYEGNGGGQRVGQFQPITETYTVPNSVIFNDNDSASLTRTPSSAGDRRTFTFSCWVKRANLTGANQPIFSAGGDDWLMFLSADTLGFNTSGSNYRIVTSQVFKDTSSWFHVVLRVDTTNATAGDRLRLYINGSEITDFGTDTNPTLNFETAFNNTGEHRIGKLVGASQYFDGYLAEINHIDGSSLGPDSFGQLDASTNRWIPKDASGLTFGTNGFYLDMETAPGTGSGAGTDSSGNGNNFTESGLAATDQVTDSPTDNFTTLNPLINSGVTLSSGNLTFTGGSGDDAVPATIPLKTGKWYWEMDLVSWSSSASVVFGGGIVDMDAPYSEMQAHYAGYAAALPGLQYPYSNPSRTIAWDKAGNDVSVTGLGTCANGDIIQFAMDLDNGALYIGRNNTWLNSGDPESGSSRTGSVFPVTPNINGWAPVANSRGSSYELQFNFGQSGGFTYTPPTGFSAISSDNLPLSNGDLSAFVWIKNRDAADNHMLFDAVRGVTKDLHSNSTAAEVTNANTLTRFLKNGFEVSNDAEVNTSGESYVAWQWLNDSLSTSANTDGSISSTVLPNTTSGFSIVSYTGTGANATVGHGLGVAPQMIIIKNRPDVDNWIVYHEAMGATKGMSLNNTAAPTTAITYFNNTAPTSSVFSIGSGGGTNGSGDAQIAYCFANVEGYSKFGEYTGNGSTDGPFIYTGFKPRFVMIKRYTAVESWPILDTARGSGIFGSPAGSGGDNPTAGNDLNAVLVASTTAAEEDNPGGSRRASYLSNGFKVRTTNTAMNASGSGYIYMAFAESPFKTATAR